jgi:opacity protein-like surface antigen
MKKTLLAVAVSTALSATSAFAASPTVEEEIDILQQEIDVLKEQMAKTSATPGPAAGATTQSIASPKAAGTATTIGGYGEFAYNHYVKGNNKNDEADLRRFVLFFGHSFNENLRFVSELEWEHGVTSRDDAGETEVEQSYINYRVSEAVNYKGGLFLIPLGLLNETHEPPTYYGVERNEVETRIIPTTWREGGFGIYGEVDEGLHYDLGITTGFNAGKFTDPSTGVREGHQEMTLARANDLSVYGALNFLGVPGMQLGGGIFTGNTGQDGYTGPGSVRQQPLLQGVKGRLILWDLHAKFTQGNLELQGLYAKGTLGDADAISAAAVADGRDGAIPKSFYGWYSQVAYHLWRRGDLDLAPFIRYEKYNTQQQVATGFVANPLNDERVITAGLSFKLHPQVVLKTDFQKYHADSSKNRFNVGLGYMF